VSSQPKTAWSPIGAWSGILPAGDFGRTGADAGLRIDLREEPAVASLLVSPNGSAAAAASLTLQFGLPLPDVGKAVTTGDATIVWAGLDQYLLVHETAMDLAALAAALGPTAALADQSDARAILRLSGPKVRAVLAKGCPLDLHPSAFRRGDAAVTAIAHVGVQIWQVDEAPVYDVAITRSYARSFAHWLTAAAAEFGGIVQRG
jgi:sarcosine oxidase subunit gamma